MTAFTDSLQDGTWYIAAANNQYLNVSEESLAPVATVYPRLVTVPTRAEAKKFQFLVLQSIDDAHAVVMIEVAGATETKYLSVDDDGSIVLGGLSTVQSMFTARQRRPDVIVLDWEDQTITYNDAGFFEIRPSESDLSFLLLAADLPIGAMLWEVQGHSAFLGAPSTYSQTQFLSSSGAGPLVTAVDLFTGKLLWEAGAGRGATSPAVVGWQSELVFVGEGSNLRALDPTSGDEIWTYACDSPIYAGAYPFASTVYVSASAGALHCVSTDDGTHLWRFPSSGTLDGLFTTAAHRDESVYFGCWNGKVYAVDANTGLQQWSYAADSKINGAVLSTDSAIYFGTDSGMMHCLDRSSGALIWSDMTNGLIQGRPAVAGSLLLAGTFGGSLYAYDAASGVPHWTISIGDPIVSDLSVADGMVYFTTLSGMLYGVDLDSPMSQSTFSLEGSSAGQVSLFCGAAYAANNSGKLFSVAADFDDGYRPVDVNAMLLLSSFADTISPDGAATDVLPSNWEVLATAFDPSETGHATAALVRIVLPSDDTTVLVAAFGTMIGNYSLYYFAEKVLLTPLPPSIAGSGAPPGLQVADSTLNGYLAVRAALLAALPKDTKTLYVTGDAQGGAFATLAALDLTIAKSDTPGASVVAHTFGSPAAGNAAFADYYNETVSLTYRVIINGDGSVASLPADRGFQHVNRQVTTGQGFPDLGGVTANVLSYRQYLSGQQ